MSEAELIQAMHEQRAPYTGPDDEDYTYHGAPLPDLVRPAEVAQLRARVAELEARLAGEEETARLRMINERLGQENMTLSELAADRARIIAELEGRLALVDSYGEWMRGTPKPLPFAEWVTRLEGLARLVMESNS